MKSLLSIDTRASFVGRAEVWLLPLAVGICGICLALPGLSSGTLGGALACAAVAILLYVPASALMPLYFSYLLFEGAFKIWSGYNPIVHVGSDLLLIAVFVRLLNRKLRGLAAVQPEEAARRRLAIVANALIVFWLWVLLQFVNPWGLGLLPSLAGLKVYVVPILTFFAIGFLSTDEEAKRLPYVILVLGIFEAVVTLVDWGIGPQLLVALFPRYAKIAADFLKGFPYRPFGTTYLPGAPAVWMAHATIAAVLVRHLNGSELTPSRRWRLALVIFFPLCFGALIACQVRVLFARCLLAIAGGIAMESRRRAFQVFLFLCVAVPCWSLLAPDVRPGDIEAKSGLSERVGQAFARLRTLEQTSTWRTARGGTWAIEEFRRRAGQTWNGAGLSRVGAASTPWLDMAKKEAKFGKSLAFADNVYLAIFTELGIGGLLAFLLVAGVLVSQLGFSGSYAGRIAFLSCVMMLAAGYGSEGILYQPDASFFWAYAALGLRLHGGSRWAPRRRKVAEPALISLRRAGVVPC
jgi:hypothetical protein